MALDIQLYADLSPQEILERQSSNHTPPVSNSQPNTNSQNQHVYNENSPVHTQSGGGSPSVHSPSSTPHASQPGEYHHALNYVKKVKNRFQGQPDIFKQFLEILFTYKKGLENLKDGVHSVTKPLTDAEVYSQIAKLLQNQEDLLQEFEYFLPDLNGTANVLVGLDSEIRHEVLQSEDTNSMNSEDDDVANASDSTWSSSCTNSSSICIIDTEYENEMDAVLQELECKPKPSEIYNSDHQEVDYYLTEINNPYRYFHTESSVFSHEENETTNIPFFPLSEIPPLDFNHFKFEAPVTTCEDVKLKNVEIAPPLQIPTGPFTFEAPVTTCEDVKCKNVEIAPPLQIPTGPFTVFPPSPLINCSSNTITSTSSIFSPRKGESRGVKTNTSRSLEDDVDKPLEVKAEENKEREHDNNAKKRICARDVTETVKEPVCSSDMVYSKTDKPLSTKSISLTQAFAITNSVLTKLENRMREICTRSLLQSPHEETIDERISVENDMQKDNTSSQNRVGFKKRGKKNDSFISVLVIWFLITVFTVGCFYYNQKEVHDVAKKEIDVLTETVAKNEIMDRFSRVYLLIDVLQKKVDKLERAQVKNAEDISFNEVRSETDQLKKSTSEKKTKKDINFSFWKVTDLRKNAQWICLGISAIIIVVISYLKPSKYFIACGVIGLIIALCNHFLDVKMRQ